MGITYSLVEDTSGRGLDADNEFFSISGNKLLVAMTLTVGDKSIFVERDDDGSKTENAFTVPVIDEVCGTEDMGSTDMGSTDMPTAMPCVPEASGGEAYETSEQGIEVGTVGGGCQSELMATGGEAYETSMAGTETIRILNNR